MKKYIHFFKNDFEDRGMIQKKGTIFSVTMEDNNLDNCVGLELDDEQWNDIFDYKYINGELIHDPKPKVSNESEQFQALVLLELAKIKAGGNGYD